MPFVINSPVRMCCGQPRGECTCTPTVTNSGHRPLGRSEMAAWRTYQWAHTTEHPEGDTAGIGAVLDGPVAKAAAAAQKGDAGAAARHHTDAANALEQLA